MSPTFEQFIRINNLLLLLCIYVEFVYRIYRWWAARKRTGELGALMTAIFMPWSSGYATPILHKIGAALAMFWGLLGIVLSVILLVALPKEPFYLAEFAAGLIISRTCCLAALRLRGGNLQFYGRGLRWHNEVCTWNDIFNYRWKFDSGRDVLVISRRGLYSSVPLRLFCTCSPADVARIAQLMSQSASNADQSQPRTPQVAASAA
ncbi:MAG: hypothetical protein K1X74_07035 [Pirellulales bacterium]|nr:hypothetical protein [Pirellulales bacterium]